MVERYLVDTRCRFDSYPVTMDISEMNGETIYKCKKCDTFKVKDSFKKRKTCRLGIESICKECANQAERERRVKVPIPPARVKPYRLSKSPIPSVDIPQELMESLEIRVRCHGMDHVAGNLGLSKTFLEDILSGTLKRVEWPLYERICIYTGRHEYMDLIPELC